MLDRVSAQDGGRIAIAAAVVAARVHRYPVWHSGMFDDIHSRVDLVEEVTYLTKAAQEVRDHYRLAEVPTGGVKVDDEVAAVYVQKSTLLQQRLDSLMERLRALDELRVTIGRIQEEQDRREWMQRAGTIDDVDTAADAVADSLHAVDLRDRAILSEAVARIYAEDIDPRRP